MAYSWIYEIAKAVIFYAISYALTPRPDSPSLAGSAELKAPTASIGRPLPKLFGTITIKSCNILWHGNSMRRVYEISAGGK